LTKGINVLKLYFLSLQLQQNKLESWSLAIFISSQSNICEEVNYYITIGKQLKKISFGSKITVSGKLARFRLCKILLLKMEQSS
jgi:hypothetical protein